MFPDDIFDNDIPDMSLELLAAAIEALLKACPTADLFIMHPNDLEGLDVEIGIDDATGQAGFMLNGHRILVTDSCQEGGIFAGHIERELDPRCTTNTVGIS